jgi:hypothetical protein
MGLTIWKYPLTGGGFVDFKQADEEIEMPCTKRILHVGRDPQGQMCIWAMVNPEDPKNKYKISIRGTGHDASDVAHHQFIGTVFDGPYVWHIFIDGCDSRSIEGLEGAMDDLDIPDLDDVESKISDVESSIDDAKGDIDGLRGDIQDLEGRVELLEDPD